MYLGLMLICDDREAEGKRGSREKVNNQQNHKLKESWKEGKIIIHVFSFTSAFIYESLWILTLFQFHLYWSISAVIIVTFEHAKPVMSGDTCTQLSVPSWCQRQRTGGALISSSSNSHVLTYSLLAHSDSSMVVSCHAMFHTYCRCPLIPLFE